ncbi:MAG: SIMPL domain-containing protein [Lachnospiraceae bacterium]|nr:SIMPL domain-containing protein [Lachnospiraceae bacterium]
MGKLEVRGSASKTVDYDLMRIKLDFHAKENTAKEASQKVMRECEEFLGVLKKSGIDISNISLSSDSIDLSRDFHNDGNRDYYRANRILEIESEFNMKMINNIRSITNSSNAQVGFCVDYKLSNEDAIRQELLTEALKDAKRQAEVMARAIDHKVVGLISADKNAPELNSVYVGEIDSLELCSEQEFEPYDNSDELSPSNETYTETIYTTWEIAIL